MLAEWSDSGNREALDKLMPIEQRKKGVPY